MIHHAIEKIASTIAFKFICGIAGIIIGLMLIVNFSKLIQIAGIFSAILTTAALFADSIIVKEVKGTAAFIKMLLWLGIANIGSILHLMFLEGNLLVNISAGILLIISNALVAIIAVAEWKIFSTV